jgi:hypothetical protein
MPPDPRSGEWGKAVKTFARHLDGVGAVLAEADRCASIIAGFLATGLLDRRPNKRLRDHVQSFASSLAEARRIGVADSDEARVLLRDGVNVIQELRRIMVGPGSAHRDLWKRSAALLAEMKPHYCRHHGFEESDRVGMTSCGHALKGRIVHLDPFNNDRGRAVFDGSEHEIEVEIAWLHHVPAYPERAPQAA